MVRAIKLISVALWISLLAVWASPAKGQFYGGKTLTMVINFGPGGPTDIEARLVASHLGKHIPGNPTIVVKNMGGGGGMIGTNFLGEVAKADGRTMGFITWNPIAPMLGDKALRVSYPDFEFVAGMQTPVLTYIRTDVAPGLEQPADIAKTNGFTFGGIRATVQTDLRARMALDMLGVKYKYTTGIKGLARARAAVQRNEVQMTGTSLPGYRGRVEPTMVKTGIVIPLYQYAPPDPGGKSQRAKGLPEVPTFLELYQQTHGMGKAPSGDIYQTFTLINSFFGNMNRAVFFPKGTDPKTVAIVRKAFKSMANDDEFRTAYKKVVKQDPVILVGESGEEVIAKLTNISPKIKGFLKNYVAEVTK